MQSTAATTQAFSADIPVHALAGGALIRRLDVERQLEALPSSHEQWPMWMGEMFDHAEMVEQVRRSKRVRCFTMQRWRR
jgi:hypothetical protein